MGEILFEELKDIRNVNIDFSKPIDERIKSLCGQVSDPYHFKYKKVKITVEYTGSVPIEEIILS